MTDQLARDVGERVRFHRLAARKTQVVVAGLAGITTDYLYQIERGRKLPTLPVLIALARALGVPVTGLIVESAGTATARHDEQVGDDALHRAMFIAPTGETDEEDALPHGDLRAQIDAVWGLWQSSPTRYSKVRALLAQLITECERALRAAEGDAALRQASRLAADVYGLTRSVAKRSGRVDLAIVAADRARRNAQVSTDPLRSGVASWNLAHASLASGDEALAEDIAMTAASAALRRQLGPDAAAVYGSLILVASIAAARRGDAWTARERIRSVTSLAAKVGERNTLWTAFGPTNVAMHAVTIEIEAGEVGQASRLADEIDYERSPSIERRVAFLLDQARSYQRRSDHGNALLLLQVAERHAPEDVAFRPLAHDIVRGIVHRAGRTTAAQAAQLADRLAVALH